MESPCGGLVVKRTFLEFVDPDAQPLLDGLSKGGRDRAYSDPGRARAGSCSGDEEFGATAHSPGALGTADVDFELTGLSDLETDAEEEEKGVEVPDLHVNYHKTSCSSASSCSNSSHFDAYVDRARQAVLSASDSLDLELLSGSDKSEQNLCQLLRDNARLSLENKLLRENAHLASSNAKLERQAASSRLEGAPVKAADRVEPPAAVAPKGNAPEAYACVPAVPPGTWLVPMSVEMVPVFAVSPGFQNSNAKGHADIGKSPKKTDMSGRRGATGRSARKADEPPNAGDKRTTVMLRNLPNNYNRAMLLELLDLEGFAERYDFIYLPIDFKTQACLGYAFVNLVAPELVPAFWNKFDGFAKWKVPSRKVCGVTWSGPHQGRDAHVDRYRNSPVMHPLVPEEYKPIVLESGKLAVFPAPTKALKAPRTRKCTWSPEGGA